MGEQRVIDYGSPARFRVNVRVVLAILVWLKRHWFALVLSLALLTGLLAALGRWRAGVLTRRAVTLSAPLWEEVVAGSFSVGFMSSFGDNEIPHYEAKVTKGRIGNVMWPVTGVLLSGRPTRIGSNRPSSFWDTLPSAALPAGGGNVTITYTLELTGSPNPWRCFFYFGTVTETVERSVVINIPAGIGLQRVPATAPATTQSTHSDATRID